MSSFNQNRRPGLIAGLNFNLPHVPKTPKIKKDQAPVTAIMRLPGKKRKAARHQLDLSTLYRKMNPEASKDEWMPQFAAIGNDSVKRLFLIFDHERDIAESVELSYAKGGRLVMNSKAAIMKILLCMPEVQKPQVDDSGLLIEFDVRMINQDPTMWELVPNRQIQEFADEKLPPRIIPFK